MFQLAGVDPTDDWVDPDTKVTHGIDGVDIWPSLMSPGGKTRPAREWLPTTERSLLWDDAKSGHMWKLITLERRANRFHPNGSQYLDSDLPCLPNSSLPSGVPSVGPDDSSSKPWGSGCFICSPEAPCLFGARPGSHLSGYPAV